MHRLGRNHGGYRGERVPLDEFLQRVDHAAARHGWRTDPFRCEPGLPLLALVRQAQPSPPPPTNPRTSSLAPVTRLPRLYLSTGIHGDEPAGLLAILRLLEEDLLPACLEVSVCPCLNPTGCRAGTRENEAGRDLNRDYRQPQSPEIQAHVDWLQRQPAFDLTFCLHEDWEAHGFYLYELNPDNRPSLAAIMINAVRSVCPIDLSPEIEGRPAQGGIIRPNLDPASRPEWPEAFYLLQNKTRQSYTLEAPSDFPLATRATALVTAVQAALARFLAPPQ